MKVMKKIENRKELNTYFKQVNSEIDKYLTDHKIRPSRLSKYIKNNGGVNKFIKDLGLSDISGIDRVVDQALKSRLHMEKDGILKFESFRLLESMENIEDSELLTLDSIARDMNSGIEYEKILADHFDTSLGHIEESHNSHMYTVDVMGKKYEAYVFLDKDIAGVHDTILEHIKQQIPKQINVKVTKSQLASVSIP